MVSIFDRIYSEYTENVRETSFPVEQYPALASLADLAAKRSRMRQLYHEGQLSPLVPPPEEDSEEQAQMEEFVKGMFIGTLATVTALKEYAELEQFEQPAENKDE